MLVRSHHHFTGQPIDVWVDSAIATGCDAYLGCLSALPATVQNFAQHQPLFWDERVLPRVRRLGGEPSFEAIAEPLPQRIAQGSDPAILIVHPASHPNLYCENDPSDWTVFVPSLEDIPLWQGQLMPHAGHGLGGYEAGKYEASGYEASDYESGKHGSEHRFDWLAEMQAQTASGKADVEHYMLTSHSDGGGTTQLIHNLRPQHVIFVHGGSRQLTDLASLEDLQSRYQLHLPAPAQVIDLPLAEAFWQPAPPRNTLYEGEIETSPERVMLTLPTSLEGDPRWSQLADTGIVRRVGRAISSLFGG